jgi:hypothetical protein
MVGLDDVMRLLRSTPLWALTFTALTFTSSAGALVMSRYEFMKVIKLRDALVQVNARANLFANQTLVAPEGEATFRREVCLKEMQGPSVPISITELK